MTSEEETKAHEDRTVENVYMAARVLNEAIMGATNIGLIVEIDVDAIRIEQISLNDPRIIPNIQARVMKVLSSRRPA